MQSNNRSTVNEIRIMASDGSIVICFYKRSACPGVVRRPYQRYWRVNKKVKGTFVLTVEEMSSGFSFSEPLVDKFFKLTAKPWRLQKISLAKLRVRLKKNVDYKWTVALVCNKKMRSSDIGQSGGIRYVSKPWRVKRNWRTLAKNGVWYDAFRRASKNKRKRLLREIGL